MGGFPKTSVFGKATLDFMGKNGLQTVFSRVFHKTNRVLGKAHG
jgi:hypothetical protein